MQFIYHYDPATMIFDQTIMVEKLPDQLPANTTTVSPYSVVQPAKWDPAAQKWLGHSIDDWHAQYNNQAEQPQPTAEQQQLAELIKSNAQQTTLNAQLIKQVATLTAGATQSTREAE